MSQLLPRLIIQGQEIVYCDKLKIKFGAAKREYKVNIDGTILASESRDDTASHITIPLQNNNKAMRDLMIQLYNTAVGRNGEGVLIGKVIYTNDIQNPIVFNGGSLMELPEIEDQGVTEYTFKFNYYSKTK